MSIAKLHWDVRRKTNRLSTNHNSNVLTAALIDSLIHEASLLMIERFGFKTNSNFGLETTQQMYDMFSNLIVAEEEITATQVEGKDNVYEVKLDTLKYPYLHLVHGSVTTNHCANNKVIIVPHQNLSYVLDDAFQRPSKKWKRIVGTFVKNSSNDTKQSLYLYVDEGVEIEKLYLDYVRCPRKVFLGGYNSLEYRECLKNNQNDATKCQAFYNTSSAPVDSEINEKYHYLLADIVAELFGREKEHGGKVQMNVTKQQSMI